MRSIGVMLGLLAIAATAPALAQVNKWVDENGRVQYGDRPPAKQSSGAVQLQKAPAKEPRKAPPGKPLAVQPKNHVPGDPLLQRMKENEERKQVDRATSDCWKSGGPDCDDAGAIREKLAAEAKARETVTKKPATREPLPADFCKRNPKVEGCLPKK